MKTINYNLKTRLFNILKFILVLFVAILFIFPVLIVIMNSFKSNTEIGNSIFKFPSFNAGFSNYINGMTFGDYPFIKSVLYSFLITIISTFLILLCTSMCAWFIVRVNNVICKIIYYLCIFSMVVPFQMVMYTLASIADKLYLNTPFTIPIIYLGFGAGLAVFMFSGFVKSIPLEIEEAASIDGCNPLQTFFKIVLPICKPILISVGILEVMWIYNDYLLPYLVLDIKLYRTIPIHIQYLQGSYGRVDLGATMALIVLCLIPIVILYMFFQKYIIKGVIAGAVKS